MTIVSDPTAARSALIPLRVLFGSPSRLAPLLSPDGDRIAFLAPLDGVSNVWVRSVADADEVPVTRDTRRGVAGFSWASDGRHVLYLRDGDGDERNHLIAVDTVDPTHPARDVTPFPGVQARLIGLDPADRESVLVGLNLSEPSRHDAYRLHIPTGTSTLDARNHGFASWVVAEGTSAGAALRIEPDGAATLLVRADGDPDGWRPCYQEPAQDANTFRTIGFGPGGLELWVLSARDHDTNRLVAVDVRTGATRVGFQDPRYDVDRVSVNPRTRVPDIVVVQREREHAHGLTDEVARDLDLLRAGFRGDVRVVSRARDDRRWLVQHVVDDGLATYCLFDRDTSDVRALFDHQPDLAGYRLARVEPFSFTARDGMTVAGYLTFPPGRPRTGLPTVLVVHGGPWARDIWGLRGESQWLANRGYLCVQVNFRGSTGYGKRFVNAGNREWGGRMQDDLTDAVHRVVASGLADRDRVAIYGASYGGYAALAGVCFTPEVYRCAVALNAPANLSTFVASTPGYGGPAAARLVARIGDPVADAGLLAARSPLSAVDQVRVPVFVAHGAHDPRVPQAEADAFVAALRARGVPHEYLVFPDEGHYLVRPANRLSFYAAAERFLATYLGGECEPTDVTR